MAEAARLDELADSLPAPPVEAADVGGDSVNADDGRNGTVSPEAEPPSPSPSDDSDPLDKLLSQWDEDQNRNNGSAAPSSDTDDLDRMLADLAADEQRAAQQQQTAEQQAQSAIEIAQRDRQLGELQQTVGQLQNAIAQEVLRQHQQRSLEDFEKLAAREQQNLAADVPGVDDDHVKRWMLSEGAQDPNLVAAWEARYYQPPGPVERANIASQIQAWGENQAKIALQLSNPLARRMAQQNIEQSMRDMWSQAFPDPAAHRAAAAAYVNRALDKMRRAASKPRIDPVVSGDVMAVVQAVRGASAKSAPAEPPVRLSELSDSDLNKWSRQFGFLALSR